MYVDHCESADAVSDQYCRRGKEKENVFHNTRLDVADTTYHSLYPCWPTNLPVSDSAHYLLLCIVFPVCSGSLPVSCHLVRDS